MDIIITMPDIEREGINNLIKHYYQSKEDEELIYYRVSKLPKDLGVGDKCYIISNGEIIGSHIVKELKFVSEDEANNLSDGKWREGFYIIRESKTFQELKPRIKVTGFQGFRYFDRFIKRWKLKNNTEN